MKEFGTYDNLNSDSKEVELIDVKSKKEDNTSVKSDTNTNDSSFNDSMNQMNSLIVKEKPLSNQYSHVLPKNRQGNTCMYFFDEKGSPQIVIGPHCKK